VTESDDVEEVTVELTASFLISGAQLTGALSPVLYLSDWQRLAVNATLPLRGPTYIPIRFTYAFQRAYDIVRYERDKAATRVGYRRKGDDQYLGVSESMWLDAPLASPGMQVRENGVVYTVVGSSTKVDHVWWIQDKVLHWVTNTLFADLDREQLLAVAMSMAAVPAAAR
jgi:hypothetical protein